MKILDERAKVEHEAIKLYKYGSTVYGTDTAESDIDYIAVVKCDGDLAYNVRGNVDYIVYSESMFIKAIKIHKIDVMECIFQSKEDLYREYFKLNLTELRKEISTVSSNSYVKCKKKLQDGEVYIGLKSLFHSLRILDFGIQIAKNEKILDYSSSNHYLEEILSIGDDWSVLHKKYKSIHNSLKSELRKLCPVDKENINE